MTKDIKTHIIHYFVLFVFLTGGFLFFLRFEGEPEIRLKTVEALCLGYFLWGITHHLLERNLSLRIVLEYLLVSLATLMIFVNIFWRY
ncbi:MAG: hypothetical protein Q8N98_03850 [bacterium]|nr:hypothetical protein [bacterium]